MCIPKVANTSIKLALQQALGISGDPNYLTTFETCDKYMARELSNYCKIAFVRHPVNRLRSCYMDKVINKDFPAFDRIGIPHGISFEQFVDRVCDIPDADANQHFRAQVEDLTIDGQLVPNFVGKVEEIDEDWGHVRKICDLNGLHNVLSLSHANSTRSDFDIPAPVLDKIYVRYAQDFEVFDYAPC